jgi:acetyl-CoA carboxylase carboxyltransferase component
VNAVFYNKIQAVPQGPERDAYVEKLREEYREDVDIGKLASELVVEAVIPFEALRDEVARRFARYADKHEENAPKKHLVPPM